MKLVRFGEKGEEKPGVLDPQGHIRDLSGLVQDIDGAFLSSGMLDELASLDLTSLPLADATNRLGPCVSGVSKFICIGLNYADHAAETGAPVPQEPVIFMKAPSAISGPNDPVVQPKGSTMLDWEVELALVIGKQASYVDESHASDHIAGYCVCHDVSERGFQLHRGGQWDKGKGCDTFGPIGPWLVTRDEVDDPLNLDIYLSVNGHRFQDGNTRTMIFSPSFIVSYVSQFMRLLPGDIISTGTPPGVGMGQNPQRYLQPGDQVELGIQGLGVQRQAVIAYAPR